MLSAVLAMYSTPSHPMFRTMSTGKLCAESLKVAGAKAEKVSPLGWNAILAQSGDKRACAEIVKILSAQGVKSGEILAVLLALLPDNLCTKCNGTGTVWSPTGRRWRDCDRCNGSGRRRLNLEQICEHHSADFTAVEPIYQQCLLAISDAEQEIVRFLKQEKETAN